MELVYKSHGYQVAALRWPVSNGRVVSCNPMPEAPNNQTRRQAKKLVAKLTRKHGSEWVRERGVGVSEWRCF